MAPVTRHRPRRRGLLAVTPILLMVAATLGSCGGSSTSSGQSGATTTPTTTGASRSGGASASELKRLGSNVKAAQNATFKAVYSSTSGGSTQTITLAQAPPKQFFSTSGGSESGTMLVNTGTMTYTCSTDSTGASTCTPVGSGAGAGALTSIIGVYNGAAMLNAINSWQSLVAAHVAGASLSFSNSTIAGEPVKCAKWSYQGQSSTYCVTSNGVLAKVETSGGSASASNFELTSYSNSVSDSDFALPAGATVITLPAGVSGP